MNREITSLLTEPGDSAVLTISRVSEIQLRIVVDFNTKTPIASLLFDVETPEELDGPVEIGELRAAKIGLADAIATAARQTEAKKPKSKTVYPKPAVPAVGAPPVGTEQVGPEEGTTTEAEPPAEAPAPVEKTKELF